mgnify:CR=1 FL=1|jgi:hypothetical protein
MGTEYPHSTGTKKTRQRAGYRERTRNALYRLAQEFKRRHPKATAADAWRNLIAVAETGAHDVLVAHDQSSGVLTYRPDRGRFETREIRRRSFEQQYYRLCNISA